VLASVSDKLQNGVMYGGEMSCSNTTHKFSFERVTPGVTPEILAHYVEIIMCVFAFIVVLSRYI